MTPKITLKDLTGGQGLVLMLRAFFDDSGKSDDPAETMCCFAGCASHVSSWQTFEEKWRAILDKFAVPYLHMSEYAHSSRNSPFESWKHDHEKRDAFLSALLGVLEHHALAIYSATVPLTVWRNLSSERQSALIDPYFMCAQDVLIQSAILAELHNEPMQIVFSDQSENKGKAYKLWEYINKNHPQGKRLVAFTFVSFQAEGFTPLQAADLIAFELRRFAADLEISNATSLRVPMKRLLKMHNFFRFFDDSEVTRRFYDVPSDPFA